jgi:hypothetical protein
MCMCKIRFDLETVPNRRRTAAAYSTHPGVAENSYIGLTNQNKDPDTASGFTL